MVAGSLSFYATTASAASCSPGGRLRPQPLDLPILAAGSAYLQRARLPEHFRAVEKSLMPIFRAGSWERYARECCINRRTISPPGWLLDLDGVARFSGRPHRG
jgi:hypothetical protein